MARLHTLSNGVRVICDPIAGFETLALSVVIGRGSRWESKARSGWAHLLEHMVFKGAGGRSASDIVSVIELAGGHINAATGYERTSYQVRALKGGLGLGMAVIADLVLRPTLNAADLEREKSVIDQEIAEAADTPDDLVFDLAQTAAFGDTAMGRPILGTAASIATATPAILETFRANLYAPDRIIISAAGAVDDETLLKQAEHWFGDGVLPGAAAEPEPGVFVGGPETRTAKLEQANLVFMLPACSARDPDYYAFRLFADALGGGMSSRLFQEVREKAGLAYSIDAFVESYADTGVLGIYAGCAARDAARAAELSARQVAALADAPDEVELSRAKAQLKGGLFMARESALSRAEQSAGQVLLFGRVITPAELTERIDAVSIDDLRRVGKKALSPRLSARAVLGPAMAAMAATTFEEGLRGMSFDTDAVVVGAGAVGLATARALALRGQSVIVLEREAHIGQGVSSRNSEVIHGGLYYPTGSLKARFCVQGRRMVYPFLETHHVAYKRCEKLVVATDESEISGIEKILVQARLNDVEGIEEITGAQARALEPGLNAVHALISPQSGLMDSHGYMLALQGEIEDAGGVVVLSTPFEGATPIKGGGFSVRAGGDEPTVITTRLLVIAASLGAQDAAAAIEGYPAAQIPKLHYGKGVYFALQGKAPFERLIYPPPIPGALGTHYRCDLGGQARFGPDLQFVDAIDYTVDPARAPSFYEKVRKFWPGLPDGALVPDYAGIRPKLHGPGEPAPDFRLDGQEMHGFEGLVAMFGIESPGLTSSMAIGEEVAGMLLAAGPAPLPEPTMGGSA